MREQYFTRDGRPIPEHEAVDHRGILRDGVIARTRMSMRDSIPPQRLPVVDAAGGMHRPGFRLPATGTRITLDDGSDAMSARDKAYADYEDQLVNAYKNPVGFGGAPSITGFGEHGGVGQGEGGTMLDCEENAEDISAHTESARRRDHRTVEQMMRDHQNNMVDIYDKFDCELSETWRGS